MTESTRDVSDDPAALSSLPEELHLAIIEKLDVASLFALSRTSRQFQRLADPLDTSRRCALEDFLIEAQYFARWQAQDGFACFTCSKVLPRNDFGDTQIKGKHGLNGNKQRLRFCIECGVTKRRYPPGARIYQGASVQFVCRSCRQLKGGRSCARCTICSACDNVYGHPLACCEGEGRARGHAVVGGPMPENFGPESFPNLYPMGVAL